MVAASHTGAANATRAVQDADKWCGWAHSFIDDGGIAVAPVYRNTRWGIAPALQKIPRRWAAVQI